MAKNDARKNGFEKTNPEDLAAKEEKFRTFFSTSVAQVPDEMKHRDDEKQEPAKQKTQSSILGRILGRAKEEAEPAPEKPAMPQELPPTGEIRLGGEDEAAEPKADLELAADFFVAEEPEPPVQPAPAAPAERKSAAEKQPAPQPKYEKNYVRGPLTPQEQKEHAEMQELKANPNRAAKGTVIEARLDKNRGPIATLLVQNGTLHKGDLIIAGTAVGRVRVMTDDKGRAIQSAGPSIPVEITGLAETPTPGDEFDAVADERMARQLVEQRKQAEKDAAAKQASKVTLDNLFAKMQEGEMKELNLIVKADVQGSAEAVRASLEKLSNEEVRVRVIHAGVGAINESDILLASTANAIVVGFNVRPDAAAQASAQRANVDIRMYRVIYDAIDEIEAAMKGMLAPKYREAIIGHAEVRQTYKVSAIGTIAGCYVKDGKVTRDSKVRVLRDNIVIYEGEIGSLQRFKDSVKEVAQNYECGMSIDKFNDIKEGDIFECYVMEEIPR